MLKKLIRNFLSLAGAESISKLITFAAFAYLARVCGPAGFGYIEWAGTVLMCGSLVVDQGFSLYGAKEIAMHPSSTARLVSEVVTARFMLSVLAYALIAIFAFLAVSDTAVRNLLLVFGLSLWALPVLLQWVFQGHDQMRLVGLMQIVRQTLFVTTVFVFVGSVDDLIWVGVAETMGVFGAAILSVALFRRYFPGKRIQPKLSTRLIREGTPIGLSQMLWVVRMFGATLIVGLIATAEDTGYFAGAMRIYIALHTFVWLYFFNLLPSMSRASQEAPGQLAKLIRRSFLIVTPLGLGVLAIWVWTAAFMMAQIYGSDFLPGAGALRWLAGACVAAAFSGHYRFGLIASGLQSKEMVAMGVGAAVALLAVPIGYFNAGTSGAAAGLFVAELLVLAASWFFANQTFLKTFNRFVPKEPTFGTLPEGVK